MYFFIEYFFNHFLMLFFLSLSQHLMYYFAFMEYNSITMIFLICNIVLLFAIYLSYNIHYKKNHVCSLYCKILSKICIFWLNGSSISFLLSFCCAIDVVKDMMHYVLMLLFNIFFSKLIKVSFYNNVINGKSTALYIIDF